MFAERPPATYMIFHWSVAMCECTASAQCESHDVFLAKAKMPTSPTGQRGASFTKTFLTDPDRDVHGTDYVQTAANEP